jgi:hypothetical protein
MNGYAGFQPGRTGDCELPQVHAGLSNTSKHGRKGVVAGASHGYGKTIDDMNPAYKVPSRFGRVTTEILDPTKVAIRMNLNKTANPFDRDTAQKRNPERLARAAAIRESVWSAHLETAFETREATRASKTRKPQLRTEQQTWSTTRANQRTNTRSGAINGADRRKQELLHKQTTIRSNDPSICTAASITTARQHLASPTYRDRYSRTDPDSFGNHPLQLVADGIRM